MPATARAESEARWPRVAFTKDAAQTYLAKMKPWSYRAESIHLRLVMQAPRALIAPTTILLFVATLLPYVGLWSLASSLSLLFSPMPFMLTESALGVLMTGPFLLTTAVAAATILALTFVFKRYTSAIHVAIISTGTAIASIGVFGFGLYIKGIMQIPAGSDVDSATPWTLGYLGDRLSLPVVSLLLGLLGAGSLMLDATIRPTIQRSTAFTSSSLQVGLRNTADMNGGLACLRSLAAGVFVLGVPNAVWSWDGLKAATVGMGAAQVAIAAAVCAVWWFCDEHVKRWDGRAMGLVDLSLLKRQVSFFDTT